MTDLNKIFQSQIKNLLQDERKIAIAVSGGSDSMALALLANEYAKESGMKITAVTIDHGLRPEAAFEAIKVGEWLAKYGIKHHILCWEGDKKLSNIQAEARSARYNLMADFCAKLDIKSLLVGHTLNDQAETVLMRIMRGSGVDGLAGIPAISNVFGVNVIRPLLQLNREELRAYLRGKNQEWIEDPSNENTKFTRVQVRKLISENPEPQLFTQRLADMASHMARAKDYIEARISERIKGIVTFHDEGFYTINISKFKELHKEERLRILASTLQHISGDAYKPRFDNLEYLHDNILNGNIASGSTLWGCAIATSKKQREENILFIYREPAAVMGDMEIINNSQIKWDGRFLCNVGDVKDKNLKIGALGKSGFEALVRAGFIPELLKKELPAEMQLAKLFMPKKVIYTFPALKTLEKVLAVPHIGYYVDENLRQVFCSENVRM